MTVDQELLLKKAHDSLHAARVLEREGLYDFSASRSYYAMFYAVQALLLGRKLAFSKHSAVIAAFGREFAKEGGVPIDFHRYLIEAQEDRRLTIFRVRFYLWPFWPSARCSRCGSASRGQQTR